MTLEDFFTLTEMKDGLTAPSRVQELVAVMQEEKDCIVKNIGDATRQWAAVASTIAATDNKDCLDLFIKLDGLWFIDRWLKDAQQFSNDASDGSVEESITALLRALEKLQVDKERSISSGVWITVNSLLGHNSSRVQDSARALFDSWKPGKVSDAIHQDVQGVGAVHDVSVNDSETGKTECAAVDIPLSKGSVDLGVESKATEHTGDEILQSRSSHSFQPESAEDVQIQTRENDHLPHNILDHRNMEHRSEDPPTTTVDGCSDPLTTSIVSNSVRESPSLKEKSPLSAVQGTASTEAHSLAVLPKTHVTEPESEVPKMLTDKSGFIACASSDMEPGAISAVNVPTHAQEFETESALQNNVSAKEDNCCLSTSVLGGVTKPVSTSKAGTDEAWAINHCKTPMFDSKDSEFSPDAPQVLSGNKSILEKHGGLSSPSSRMEDIGVTDDDGEHSSDRDEDLRDSSGSSKPTRDNLRDSSGSSKPTRDTRSPKLIDRRSDIELDYGMVDALEVARQVAQEVEREVVDYREPSCSSSSERIMQLGNEQPGSPDSIHGKHDLSSEIPPEDVSTRQNHSSEACAEEVRQLISANKPGNEVENCMNEMESSQVTEVAQEPGVNMEKGLCGFDLNQEVCSDDMDRPANPISTPISVVSASRPAAASGSPVAPLQFEGTLGWRGSAATSAFRPASPRKISDGDKTLETGGTSNSSKQRHAYLDIDLNVAEGGEEKVMDLISAKQIPVSSGFHSGESSLEVGSRRSERPTLDLNRVSDEGDTAPTDLKMDGRLFYPRNGHRSPSPASSSSSMQPSLRNFDLNDRPFFLNDSLDQGLYHGKSFQTTGAYGGSKPRDPVISILGTRVEVGSRVEVERRDYVPQTPSLPNGKPLEPAMDANVARMGGVLGMVPTVSYTHSPVFGYNGLATAPTMSISSAMYGPGGSIPYMVDSRGAPVVPQILGSASAVPPYSQPPFIMSISGTPLGLNAAGPSRPNFDLNSGFAIEGGNTGGLRQLFMPGQGSSQPSSSSAVGGKRKEPDGGWDPSYSLQYKHPQPPW